MSDRKVQCIPPTSRVKVCRATAYHLSNAYCYYGRLGVIILLRVRCHQKYIFLVFSERKFRTFQRTFLTPSRQPLNRFSWNLVSLLSDSLPRKRVGDFLFSFSVFEASSFFQRKCWWFVPSYFILLLQMNKCTCQKSETKATGLDNISAKLLRECPDVLAESLAHLFYKLVLPQPRTDYLKRSFFCAAELTCRTTYLQT